jgi:hypothetical protein
MVVTAAVASVAATAGSARANAPVTGCPQAPVSHPFAPWGDSGDYVLAENGGVEAGAAGWSLSGGAGVVEGNETYLAAGASDHRSVRLPGSSSATSAPTCVDGDRPGFRFFAKRRGGSPAGGLDVQVVATDASGNELVSQAGTITPTSDWRPSASMPTMASVFAAAGPADVSFRFKPRGGGVWSIDDIFVDPLRIG